MAKPNPRSANGHRRRQVIAHVRARDTHCALCDQWVDPTLTVLPHTHGPRCPRTTCTGCVPDPRRGEVDEDIPVSQGGSPYDPNNCALMHRECNRWKSDRTLAQARAALHAQGVQQPRDTTERPIKTRHKW